MEPSARTRLEHKSGIGAGESETGYWNELTIAQREAQAEDGVRGKWFRGVLCTCGDVSWIRKGNTRPRLRMDGCRLDPRAGGQLADYEVQRYCIVRCLVQIYLLNTFGETWMWSWPMEELLGFNGKHELDRCRVSNVSGQSDGA